MIISLDKYKKTGHLKPEEELHIELTENGVFEYFPSEGSVYSKAIVTVNVTSTEIPSGNIENGEYLIVSSDNRLVSSEGNGKLNAVLGSTFVNPDTSTPFDPVVNPDTSIVTDDKLKWSIVNDEDKYYIYNIVDNVKMYMSWDSSKYGNHAQIQTDVYPLHIDADPENLNRYKISIIDNEAGRYLQRNNSNEYFAFYSSGQKGSVYLIKISDEVKEPEPVTEPGVYFDDGDEPIIILYTGASQELSIPFNWYPGGDLVWTESYGLAYGLYNKGIDSSIRVIESAEEGYTHELIIDVNPNPYNETINEKISFNYIDSAGNWNEYTKTIELQANPEGLGFISVSTNFEGEPLPSSVERYEVLFNVQNAEYKEAIAHDSIENFSVEFVPTDVEGYTHVAYITYNNTSSELSIIELFFSNGYYSEFIGFAVQPAEPQSNVDTAKWGNPDEATPVTMAEFVAAEPVSINTETGEVSNAQWYEITGKILAAGVENGKFFLQSIDGDCGQNIYKFENAIVICSSNDNIAMMEPIGNGWDWFPGDGADIKLRTLKHNYDHNIQEEGDLSESDNGKTIGGSYKGSPCAIYIETIGDASEPTNIIFNDAYAEYNADDDTVIIKYNINVEQENRPLPRLILYNAYEVEIGELPIDNYNNGEYNQVVVDRTDDMTPDLYIRVMGDFNGESFMMAEAPVYIVGFPEPEPEPL